MARFLRAALVACLALASVPAAGQTRGNPSYNTVTATSFIGPLSGNAATASMLATPRTVALSGDATCSYAFDGSANASCAVVLAASGVTAGTYGSTTAVPVVVVDAKGRITGVTSRDLTEPCARPRSPSTEPRKDKRCGRTG